MTTQKQKDQLDSLTQLLTEKADLLGLTALREESEIRWQLVEDSQHAIPFLEGRKKILDLGCGGGVPGLILAILLPESRITLLDSSVRKTQFVADCIKKLELENARVLCLRSEELARESAHRGHYDAVTAKAVTKMSSLVELAIPFLKVQGQLVAFKGPRVDQEILEAKNAFRELKSKVVLHHRYEFGDRDYRIVVVEKMQKTSGKYPRKVGLPQKKPL